MPIGDLDVPVIGKNAVIAILVQSHILGVAAFFGFSMILTVAGGSVRFTYWISKDE
jgi:cytochrome bd ubiquinol oxidase subunit I